MRVATNTLYTMSISRINQVKSDLLDSNTAVATGKKINTLSDDPVSVSTILGLKSSLAGVSQYSTNIATGRQWLEGGETALSNVKEQITNAKTTAISMINGAMTAADYQTGVDTIQGIIDHVLTLANTEVNGQYIFSGTKTNIKSFVPDNPDDPTSITYEGGDTPFSIHMAESSDIKVGYTGSSVFENTYITVDETNNMIDFREDPAGGAVQYGAELTAVIPNGKYTPEELAQAIGQVMTTRSAAANQPEIINVSQNNATVVVDKYSALTVPTGGTPIALTYTAATNTWAIANDPGYAPPITVNALYSDANGVSLDFDGDQVSDMTVSFDSAVADGYSVGFDITAAAAGGNDAVYTVNYNSGTRKFNITQTGGPALDNLQMMWATGVNKDSSIAPDIGFDVSADLTGVPDGTTHTSDNDVTWGIFNTLIELKNYLQNGDTAGINRSITRLNTDFDSIGAVVADNGVKQNRLDVRDNILMELNVSYEQTKSTIEDTDMVAELTKLSQNEFTYNAALSATSKLLQTSLLDYL